MGTDRDSCYSYVFSNIHSYMVSKPPLSIMLLWVFTVSISFLAFGIYVTSHNIIDYSATETFDEMLHSFTSLTFCSLNTTRSTPNITFSSDTQSESFVDISFSLPAVVSSSLLLYDFTKMEVNLPAYWILPIDSHFHDIEVSAFFQPSSGVILSANTTSTTQTCVTLKINKAALPDQLPLLECTPNKSNATKVVHMNAQSHHSNKITKRYQCSTGYEVFFERRTERKPVFLDNWEISKLHDRLKVTSYIFMTCFCSAFFYMAVKGNG